MCTFFKACFNCPTPPPHTHTHTHFSEHVHIPATSIPQKKTSRRKPTINTSPTVVSTTIPAMIPGDKPGRAACVKSQRQIPVYQSTELAQAPLKLVKQTPKCNLPNVTCDELYCGHYSTNGAALTYMVVQLCKLSPHEIDETMFDTWSIHRFQLIPSPVTSSRTLLEAIPPILDTVQVYTPASLTSRLVISSCDLPVQLMILLPSPRRNTLPFFSQLMAGGGSPVKVHTSSKCIPSVLVSGADRLTMVG